SRESLDAIPPAERTTLEQTILRMPLSEVWQQTEAFWQKREPTQLDKAKRDPRYQMALAFRWYLGLSSRWANSGEPSRKVDYQVWCGPAMGAFNEWTRGTFLEKPAQRGAATVALNLLYGAAVLTRANFLRCQGVSIPPAALKIVPLPLEGLQAQLAD
ncbi:MAG: 2-nitropropane dioxygenase, partial [Planctomycetia bacterium]|nr:2-nitropropane dioxygenase [Planctomycetia bacterium]